MHEIPFQIQNCRGNAVWGDVRFQTSMSALPVVVMCHGFKGFKDWGPFPAWGRMLAKAGFVSILFNFSFNGVTPEHPQTFSRFDHFADNTFTRELDDLDAVICAIVDETLGAPVDSSRIGLMGHSRGGGTAILQAGRDARIGALTTWSAVSGFIERFSPTQIADFEGQGFSEILNARTGQVMRLNRTLYDDALAHRAEIFILGAAAKIHIPWLIVHAHDDESVPFAEAEMLHSASNGAVIYKASGGHTFCGRHPFECNIPNQLSSVFERTKQFLIQTLT